MHAMSVRDNEKVKRGLFRTRVVVPRCAHATNFGSLKILFGVADLVGPLSGPMRMAQPQKVWWIILLHQRAIRSPQFELSQSSND